MSEKVQITIKNKVGEKYADLQTKIVTPSKETQVITPDDGYYGLKEVIVNPPEIDGETIIDKIDELKESKLEEKDFSVEDVSTIQVQPDLLYLGLKSVSFPNPAEILLRNDMTGFETFKNKDNLAKLLNYCEWTDKDEIMFCRKIMQGRTIYIGNTVRDTFYNCTSLKKLPKISIKATTSSSMNTGIQSDNVFYNCTSLEELNFESYIPVDCRNMFYNCTNLKKINFIGDIVFMASMYTHDMFHGCQSLETITGVLNLGYSSRKFAGALFEGAPNLKNVTFGSIYGSFTLIGTSHMYNSSDNSYVEMEFGQHITTDSILSACKALKSEATLYIGSNKIAELQNVYVNENYEIVQPTESDAVLLSERLSNKNCNLG